MAKAFAKTECPPRNIDLSHNNIKSESARLMVQAGKCNKRLIRMNLEYNSVECSTLNKLKFVLAQNRFKF